MHQQIHLHLNKESLKGNAVELCRMFEERCAALNRTFTHCPKNDILKCTFTDSKFEKIR